MTASPQLPPGLRLISFDEIDSTNSEALRRLGGGEPPGAVFWARRQTAGRGRRGRSWDSPAGNLYATLTVAVPAGRPAGQFAFVAALAVGDAVRTVLPAGRRVRYKWPNDLLLDSAKLGGILIEGPAGNAGPAALAVGFGINVASSPAGAANLNGAGATVEALLGAICSAFERWADIWESRGFAPLRAAWLADAHGIGGPVEVRFADGRVMHGLFRDVDEHGALVLQPPDRATMRIATGEVFFAAA